MLCLLLRNPGRVLSREQLIENVWGYAFTGESRTVDVHVRTLRRSWERPGATSRRSGLRLQDQPRSDGGLAAYDETDLSLHPWGVSGGAAGQPGADRGGAPRLFPGPGGGRAGQHGGIHRPWRGKDGGGIPGGGPAGPLPGHMGGRGRQRALRQPGGPAGMENHAYRRRSGGPRRWAAGRRSGTPRRSPGRRSTPPAGSTTDRWCGWPAVSTPCGCWCSRPCSRWR